MKNKANLIALTYTFLAIFLAIFSYRLAKQYSAYLDCYNFILIKDLFFISTTGILFRYILSKNDKINIEINKDLRNTNEKLKESNDKYDIVAKATSDTIWDWK